MIVMSQLMITGCTGETRSIKRPRQQKYMTTGGKLDEPALCLRTKTYQIEAVSGAALVLLGVAGFVYSFCSSVFVLFCFS